MVSVLNAMYSAVLLEITSVHEPEVFFPLDHSINVQFVHTVVGVENETFPICFFQDDRFVVEHLDHVISIFEMFFDFFIQVFISLQVKCSFYSLFVVDSS